MALTKVPFKKGGLGGRFFFENFINTERNE
jgi:hypothetical protein